MGSPILNDLKDIVKQIDDSYGCKAPACCKAYCPSPMINQQPFAQVVMTCPPPILAPTRPQPVKPLQLPCCPPCAPAPTMTPDDALRIRYANFYNNYNIDWHAGGSDDCSPCRPCKPAGCGVTVDGKDPNCEDYRPKKMVPVDLPGCPTGFKPCTMRLTPPPGCDPCGVWCAQILPCPPKPKKKVSCKYVPGPCTRPCCLHWKPKDGECRYDNPCKAHCYNHPQGIKPSGRFP